MFTSFARSKLVEKLQHKFCIVKAKAIMKLHKNLHISCFNKSTMELYFHFYDRKDNF
jgi:hypothetical protein